VRQIAGVKVFRRGGVRHEDLSVPVPMGEGGHQVVVVGASTGGPPVLMTVLSALPADFPTPILVIQHITAGFLADLVKWLDGSCPLDVRIAAAGDRLRPGLVLFAPADRQLQIDASGRVTLPDGPLQDGHCPSATFTMKAVARSFGTKCVGVLLTGMGSDGAEGMVAIRKAGGVTIAQNEETSAVWGMPKQAVQKGAVQHQLPPSAIARFLVTLEMD
jgi:two-component system chemotaxis response regulator CheB